MRHLALVLVCLFTGSALAEDGDRDGLADEFENELLTKFAPSFRVSAGDCDVAPAEFLAGSRQPQVVSRNGTIYGQVFRAGAFLEVHYYHLWSRDCGRVGHALDVEHASAQVDADSLKAVQWYAGAHEETVCDASGVAKACDIGAEDGGPIVWISRGKHGSFLDRDGCARGCGGDRCEDMVRLAEGKLINIGEPGAPLNGAVWTESELWPLAAKMKTDFGPQRPVSRRSAQAVISAAGEPLDALETGQRRTESAVALASNKTDRALDTGLGTVGRQVERGRRKVVNWLRVK